MPNKKKTKSAKKQQPAGRKAAKRVLAKLDATAAGYAALLTDPCNAPLSRPLYSGTGSGYLVRTQGAVTLPFDGTTATAGRVALFPGVWDDATTPGPEARSSLTWGVGASATTTLLPGTWNSASTPGYNFLPNAATYRPVAACLEFTYTGVETARCGMYGARCTSFNNVFHNTSTAEQVVLASERTGRMPNETVTVRWCPSTDDQPWLDRSMSNEVDAFRFREENGVEFGFIGMGNGSVMVKATVVYEWTPRGYGALAGSHMTPVNSGYSVTDVLRYLEATGDWVYNTAAGGARAAASLLRGYSAGKALASGLGRMALTV